ncbi:MAG: GAF domain-containing sensor histidine kinase [Pirellula sp.]|nr:GAF domain-containing sensor histidine kinase [Pirellula sp.]
MIDIGRSPHAVSSKSADPALRTLEKFSAAASAFALELDSSKLFQRIALECIDGLSAERCIVWSVVDGRLRRECWYPESDTDWPPIEQFPDEGLRAYRHLEPVLSQPFSSAPSVRNAMYVPMVGTQHRLLGLIEIQNKRHGAFFHEQDLRTATCLARIATSAVDRARLFGRIEEWSKSVEKLLSFNATVNQHLQPREMVRQLVVNAAGFIDADGGAAGIAIHSDAEITMECDGLYFDNQWFSFLRRWRSGEGIPGTVLQTEFPLLIEDYRKHPLADPELSTRFEIGSCICVAIIQASGSVLGFFKLYRRPDKPAFSWQEAALLESLGNTVAVAIENARLVKSLERKNEQVKNLSAGHVRRLEEERQHIARELHDETGQVLIGLKLRLQHLSRNLLPEQLQVREDLDSLREQVGVATVRLKDLAKRLRPPTLDELGFEATVRQLVMEYHQSVDFRIQLSFQEQLCLSKERELALYRILQESLTNIVKHAKAKNVRILVGHSEDGLGFVTIEDDGEGFDRSQPTEGLGLVGIRERVKMLGGIVSVQSKKNSGTRIDVRQIPNNHEEKDHSG